MNIHADRIKELQEQMKAEGIDLYYIPMDDCHASEYVADHFRCIEFISGFTGSAARMLVSKDKAWLFTDGRYYIQAERELSESGIELMRSGNSGVPEPEELASSILNEGECFGFDGRIVTAASAEKFKKVLRKNTKIKYDIDLAGRIWKERPEQVFTKIRSFEEKYSGESTSSKLCRIREKIEEGISEGKDYIYIMSALDDIAWTFNIRANDVACNPVAFAYGLITNGSAVLYTGEGTVDETLKAELKEQGADCALYGPGCVCAEVSEDTTVFLDKARTGYDIYEYYGSIGCSVVNIKNPSTLMKAVKNETEKANAKDALIRDSAVLIRFMKWIKDLAAVTKEGEEITEKGSPVTELTVDEKLQELRGEDPDYIEPSFETIAAYGVNAPMMHYQASEDSFSVLKASGMLLVDSGGQYEGGTTDITRTFVLGPLTDEEKKGFTLTAVSMLRLMNAKFIKGCRGENLDIVAREPMWENGLDYKCGTGHGVGHVLNVHEGPHNIRWRIGDAPTAVLECGMIVTDEPGVYKEGRFGVRLENELIVKPYMETEDGEFLCFENMTFIPLDPDGIDKKYMSERDIELLKAYNINIYERTEALLDEETKTWLRGVLEI